MRIIFDSKIKSKQKKHTINISALIRPFKQRSEQGLAAGLAIVVFILNLSLFGNSLNDDSLMARVLAENPGLNPPLAEKINRNQLDKILAQDEHSDAAQHNLFIKTAQAANLTDNDLGDKKPFEYEVQGGDTLSNIAERYELKLNTILWANNLTAKSIIRPGQKITLLPVDGVLYTVKKGDTVSKIAALHESDSQKIIEYNEITDPTKIHAGEAIIIPDGQPLPQAALPKPPKPNNNAAEGNNIPAPSVEAPTIGKLLWPTTTKNLTQKYSAKHRGLDIANGGQPSVYASHDGMVEFAGKSGDWGNTILIRGDDGLVTRYSHNAENYVKAGDRAEAGQTIAKVGNTGRVRGATGLHLDFRIYKNGVAVNPMDYF